MKTRILKLLLVAFGLSLSTILATAGPVDPVDVNDTLEQSQIIVVTTTVQTPEIPRPTDIVFLADTTFDMQSVLADVQANAGSIISDVIGANSGTPFFAVAEYRDTIDPSIFDVDQDSTEDQSTAQAGIARWFAYGGGDWYDCQLYALNELAIGAVTFRRDSKRLIVWYGNAPGHDPCPAGSIYSEAWATVALQAAEIQVIAVDLDYGLDATGQATRISAATGGQVLRNMTANNVTDAVLARLGRLPITVVPQAVGCDPLVVSFAPTSVTLTSGEPVIFDETITAPSDPSDTGQTVICTVEFRDDEGNLLIVDGEPAIQNIAIFVPAAPPDTNADGVADTDDNCILVPNGPNMADAAGNIQVDSNGDGYGNACDADLNNDGVVNNLDVGPFVQQFGTSGPDADFNGDGAVNNLDVGSFVDMFGKAPGPSGIAP